MCGRNKLEYWFSKVKIKIDVDLTGVMNKILGVYLDF